MAPWMDRADYLAAIRRDGTALADAAEGHLGAQVPSCPDWSVSDLVWHTGEVHDFWGQVVRRRMRDPEQAEQASRPRDDELLTWYRSNLERLGDTLAAANPSGPVWTWTSTPERAAWVQRRMAQETAVHRVDAELAAGTPHPGVEPRLAADGVDEFLTYFLPEGDALSGPVETVLLQESDAGRGWVVTAGAGELVVTDGPADEPTNVDAAARARASDLLLVLWRREDAARAEVSGNGQLLDRFLARAELD